MVSNLLLMSVIGGQLLLVAVIFFGMKSNAKLSLQNEREGLRIKDKKTNWEIEREKILMSSPPPKGPDYIPLEDVPDEELRKARERFNG